MNHRSRLSTLIGVLASLLLIAVVAAPVAAAGKTTELAVYHGAAGVTLTDASSDGHQLGDLRVASIELTSEDGEPLGRLDATLTTTALDVPAVGNEIRVSTLVFSFGEDGEHQVVVGGSALYPAEGPTIETGAVTTRAILGGTGKFAGVSGEAVTEHLEDDSWVHTLFLDDVPKQKKPKKEKEPKEKKGKSDEKSGVTTVETDGPSASDEVGITRIDLGIADPGSAPGEQLGLWQYTIPAGSVLEPHTHAGWQIARIARGELEYTVIAGEGSIIHADGSSTPIGPGTYILETGDSVVENPELEHFGANRTDAEVVILAATLYEAGAPLAIPLDEPDAEASPAA